MTKSFTGFFSIVAILISCNVKPTEDTSILGMSSAKEDSKISVSSTDVVISESEPETDGESVDSSPAVEAPLSLTCKLAPSQGETRYEYPIRCATGSASPEFTFTFSRNGEAASVLRPNSFDAGTLTWLFNVPVFPGDRSIDLAAKLGPNRAPISTKIEYAALLPHKDALTLAPIADPAKNYFMIAGNGASCLTQGANFTTSDGATLASLMLKPCSNVISENYTMKLIKNADRAPSIEFLGRVTGSATPECLDVPANQFAVGTLLIRYPCHYLNPAAYANGFNQDFNLLMQSPTEFFVQSAAAPELCLGLNTAAANLQQIALVDCAAGNPVLFKAFEVPAAP